MAFWLWCCVVDFNISGKGSNSSRAYQEILFRIFIPSFPIVYELVFWGEGNGFKKYFWRFTRNWVNCF